LRVPNPKAKDTQSRSNSSTSSRSRKVGKKSFSVQSNYAAGSLKLKIAAFDPSRSAQTQVQDIKIPSSSTISLSPVKPTLNTWNSANGDGISSNLKIPIVPVILKGGHTESSTNNVSNKNTTTVPLPKDSRRITRQSLTHKSNSDDSLTVIQTGGNPFTHKNGFTPSAAEVVIPHTASSVLDKKSAKTAYSQNVNQFCFSNNKNNFVPVGVSSQLTESVTMTRLIAAPTSQDTPTTSSTLNSATIPATSALPLLASRTRNDHHLTDPVLYLASKNNDLSIFPINPSDSRIPSWNSNIESPKVVITAQGPISSSNRALSSSGKSSRRLSTHRVSLEKSDVESWDSTELGVSDAIKTMDSVVNSDKHIHPLPKKNLVLPTPPRNRVTKSVAKTSNNSNSSSSSSSYSSPLLQNFTTVVPSPSTEIHYAHTASHSTHFSNKGHKQDKDVPKVLPLEKHRSSKQHKHNIEEPADSQRRWTEGTNTNKISGVKTVIGTKAKSYPKSSGSTSSSTSSVNEALPKPSKNKLSIFVASNTSKGTTSSRSRNGRHAVVVGAYSNTTKMPSSLVPTKAVTAATGSRNRRERNGSGKEASSGKIPSGQETLQQPSIPDAYHEPNATYTKLDSKPTPIRTKAAKKYIPEPAAGPEAELVSRKWKKHSERKRSGSKKSSVVRKGKKGVLSDEELGLLCQSLTLKCTITGSSGHQNSSGRSPRRKKAKSSSPRSKQEARKERFTFEKRVFTNYKTSFALPPPSFVTNGVNPSTGQNLTSPHAHSFQAREMNMISSPPRTTNQVNKSE